jgi:hypothetical protein
MKTRALLLTLLAAVLSVTAFAQAPTRAQLQKINARYLWESGGFGNVMYLPLDTAANAEVGAKAYKNGIEYTKDTLRWRPTASGGTFVGDNMANTNLDLTGNRTHNGKGYYFKLDTIAYLRYMVYRNDPFLGNKFYSQFELDSTINGYPFRFVSALRNSTNTGDSIHTQFGTNQNGAFIYNYGLNGNRYGLFEFNGNQSAPRLNVSLLEGLKQSDFTFSNVAYLAPADSFRLRLPLGSGVAGTKMMGLQSAVGDVYTPVAIDMGNFITGLHGDVTAAGPGDALATLSNTGVIPGTYTNITATVDAKGRIVTVTNGTGGVSPSDTTNRWVNDVRRRHGTDTVEIFKNGNWQFAFKDSTGGVPAAPLNSIQYNNAGTFSGDSFYLYPIQKKILIPNYYTQYGRPVTGHFQDSAWNFANGYLWILYPRGSNGTPGQAVDPSWGGDTTQPWYCNQGSVIYDIGQPPNSAINLVGFGTTGNYRPMMRFAFEQNFYNTIERHFSVKPRLMNPNDEVRHESWTIDDRNSNAHFDLRATQIQYSWSKVDDVDYNRAFLGIGNNGVNAQTWGTSGTMSVTHGNSAAAKTIGMVVDTSSGGTGIGALYVSTNTPFLYIGNSGGSTGIDISNPATTGGVITMHKSTTTYGKPLGISGLANSSPVGLYVTTGAVGYVHNVSTDGNGYANVNTVGTVSINRDPLGFNTWDKLFSIYNNFNPNDSITHIRANGDIWTKGLLNIKTLKTTLTAPTTQGTTKMVITDTNGLLSYADIPSSTAPSDDAYNATSWNGDTDAATKNALRDKFETMITSLNSQTGAVTITAGNAITTSTLSGDITVAVDVNHSTLPHSIATYFTDASNTGTSETDLYSTTTSANTLSANGNSLYFDYTINVSDVTATVDLIVYFGGTAIGNTGALTVGATGAYRVTGYITRATSTTARATVSVIAPGAGTTLYVNETDLTSQNFATTNVMKITGQAGGAGGGTGDITGKMGKLYYQP